MLSDSLAKELMAMEIDEAIPLTRACGHYLNLVRSASDTHSVVPMNHDAEMLPYPVPCPPGCHSARLVSLSCSTG